MFTLRKESARTAYTDYISAPLPPDPETPQSFGHDVNIINIVREHGPKRIEYITRDLQKLEDQRSKLLEEMKVLERLVEASK